MSVVCDGGDEGRDVQVGHSGDCRDPPQNFALDLSGRSKSVEIPGRTHTGQVEN